MKANELLVLPLLGLTLSACGPDLIQAWEVIGPHSYGTRVEIRDADGGVALPSRAMPRPGETFTLREFVVGADELTEPLETRYDMKLVSCVGFQAPDSSLVCIPGLSTDLLAPTQVVSASEITAQIQLPPIDEASIRALASQLGFPIDEATLALISQIDQVTILGAVCVQGTVERVADTSPEENPVSELFRCNSRAESIYKDPLSFTSTVYLDVPKATDNDAGMPEPAVGPNHNPEFACDTSTAAGACNLGVLHAPEKEKVPGPIVFVGPEDPKKPTEIARTVTLWNPYPTPDALPWQNCMSDPALLQVRVGSGEHLIRVRVDPSDREDYSYTKEEYGEEVTKVTREQTIVSHAVMQYGGELARQKTVIADDVPDDQAEADVEYTPPAKNATGDGEIPPTGRTVRFFFALRDQRGGMDFTTRELCLLPKE